MHEVAESWPSALSHLVLAAACLPEVCDGGELGIDGPPTEPTVVQFLHRALSVLLAPEFDVYIADLFLKKHENSDMIESWAVGSQQTKMFLIGLIFEKNSRFKKLKDISAQISMKR